MNKQIVHISVHQTSKVISAMHTVLFTVLVILPTALGYFFHGEIAMGLMGLLIMPFIMWLFMYIGYVIACWFYNLVVPWTGGVEVNVVDHVETVPINLMENKIVPESSEIVSHVDGPILPSKE